MADPVLIFETVRFLSTERRYLPIMGYRGESQFGSSKLLNLSEIATLERQLKASIVALNKKKVAELTLIEALDDALA